MQCPPLTPCLRTRACVRSCHRVSFGLRFGFDLALGLGFCLALATLHPCFGRRRRSLPRRVGLLSRRVGLLRRGLLRFRHGVVDWERHRLNSLHVDALHVGPLPRNDLHRARDGGQRIGHHLRLALCGFADLDADARPRAHVHVCCGGGFADLRGPVFFGEVHGYWLALLLEESLAKELGQQGEDARVRAEEVVAVAQLALGFVWLVVIAQLGDAQHLGHAALLHRRHALLGVFMALAQVILDDETHFRHVQVEQRVRNRDGHQLVASLGRHLTHGDHQVIGVAVAVLVEQLALALASHLLDVRRQRRHRLGHLRWIHPARGGRCSGCHGPACVDWRGSSHAPPRASLVSVRA
mmetsp:Transcript_41653/g.66868  ORF Transcript_41653/g.66868 Transcript_41653/m.66868 type:complete len:353 (+) Transcript_41653:200-1258(+)